MNLPQAATAPAFVFRSRTRDRPRDRGLRVVAALGSLLVHLICLFAFVLGSAYEVKPPSESNGEVVQVHLIELPEPPPPPPTPPVRGTPPKTLGPRHQGRASQPLPGSRRVAASRAAKAARSPAAPPPVLAQAEKSTAPAPKPVAAPPPALSLPQAAPLPKLQPITLAVEPPAVTLPTPTPQPPVPPKIQPEPERPPQLEGNQPLLPIPSLTLSALPAKLPPPITVSSIALNAEVPKSSAPASVTPAPVPVPAAPSVPKLEPVPLSAPPAPTLDLRAKSNLPAPSVPLEQPQVQAPKIQVDVAQLAPVPLSPVVPTKVELPVSSVKVEAAETLPAPAAPSPATPPQPSTPSAVAAAALPAPPSSANKPAESPQPAAVEPSATAPSPSETQANRATGQHDVSTAPDATPQGSDNATPGLPEGVVAPAPEDLGKHGNGPAPIPGQGNAKGVGKQALGAGQLGGNQPGAAHGEKQGELTGYVQLKPQGDTAVMSHGTPNIGYRPTRFDKDWTPEGESSVDTALRHAVEKTTVAHTFHLPRGVRVECAVHPLLPIALFSCRNPDPPPVPVADKVYDRLHLAPANPLVPPAPASTHAPVVAAPIKLDNSAECAAARVAGGPPPPGCEVIVLPIKPARLPASSSSSWVPASDQFH